MHNRPSVANTARRAASSVSSSPLAAGYAHVAQNQDRRSGLHSAVSITRPHSCPRKRMIQSSSPGWKPVLLRVHMDVNIYGTCDDSANHETRGGRTWIRTDRSPLRQRQILPGQPHQHLGRTARGSFLSNQFRCPFSVVHGEELREYLNRRLRMLVGSNVEIEAMVVDLDTSCSRLMSFAASDASNT